MSASICTDQQETAEFHNLSENSSPGMEWVSLPSPTVQKGQNMWSTEAQKLGPLAVTHSFAFFGSQFQKLQFIKGFVAYSNFHVVTSRLTRTLQ